jgi:hypothetical protein
MVIYRIEQAIAKLPNRDGQITFIFDASRCYSENYDNIFLRGFVAIMTIHYPGRLYRCYWITNGLFDPLETGTLAPLNRPPHTTTVQVLKAHELSLVISRENLLAELGGDGFFDFMSKDHTWTPKILKLSNKQTKPKPVKMVDEPQSCYSCICCVPHVEKNYDYVTEDDELEPEMVAVGPVIPVSFPGLWTGK